MVRAGLGDDVVDVVIDALAHEQDRLAAAAHRGKPLGHLPQRVERRPGVERALGVFGIVDDVARLPQVAGAVVLVGPVRRRRFQFAALRAVHRGEQQSLVARELLVGLGRPGGMDNRHEVVGGQPALDELLRRRLHALGASKIRVVIVDDHHVDAAVEGLLVIPDVRLDRIGLEERTIRALDWNVDQRERADRLRLSVFKDLKILLLEIADQIASLIRDDYVDLHVIDADPEGRSLRRRSRWRLTGGRRRILACAERSTSQEGEQRRNSDSSFHDVL